jgi:integrase
MSKARNGDGALWLDPNTKKWIVEISLQSGPGGTRRRTRRTFDTQRMAKMARRRLLADRDAGLLTEIRNDTVQVYGLAWVRDVISLKVRPGTASDYEYRLRHEIIPYLGTVKVTELSTHAVEKWLAALRRSGKSAATVNGARQVLGAICKHALRNRIIAFNPVEPTSPVRRQKEDPTQVKTPWSREEISLVLSHAQTKDNLDVFLHLMLHLGLRSGEALGLRWCDIDQESGYLWINGTLKEERRILPSGEGIVRSVIVEPKTAASRRKLPISEALTAALDRQRMRQSLYQVGNHGNWVDSGHIVTTGRGTAFSASNLRRHYAQYLEEMKVRYIRFHDMRHSVATLALGDANLPIEKASQALGHTRIDTTKQIYARLVPRYNDDFVAGIENLLPKAQPVVVDRLSETTNGK